MLDADSEFLFQEPCRLHNFTQGREHRLLRLLCVLIHGSPTIYRIQPPFNSPFSYLAPKNVFVPRVAQ